MRKGELLFVFLFYQTLFLKILTNTCEFDSAVTYLSLKLFISPTSDFVQKYPDQLPVAF